MKHSMSPLNARSRLGRHLRRYALGPSLALSSLLATACGARTSDGVTGGNTNWLASCTTDAQCDDDDAVCVSKRCLSPCEDNADCPTRGATCSAVTVHEVAQGTCATQTPRDMCTPTCDSDDDCTQWGDAFTCADGACTPKCTDPVSTPPTTPPNVSTPPTPTPTSAPSPAPVGECMIVIDVPGCCPEPLARRSSFLQDHECFFQIVNGQLIDDDGTLADCQQRGSCDRACPNESWTWYGVASEDGAGECQIAPTCEDGTCPGSGCEPQLGCVTPNDSPYGRQLICVSSTCDEPGVCQLQPTWGCGPAQGVPACGCDGATYASQCEAERSGTVRHSGSCVADDAGTP